MSSATEVARANEMTRRSVAVEPRKIRPVKWWAAIGAACVLMTPLMFSLWVTSGDFKHTPSGPTPIPTWMLVSIRFWEAAATSGLVYCLYRWVARPLLRERRIGFDGLLCLALLTLFWQDPIPNAFNVVYTYNTHALQFGSWAQFLPGFVAPRAQYYAEPIVFESMLYGSFMFPGLLLANYVMPAGTGTVARARKSWGSCSPASGCSS